MILADLGEDRYLGRVDQEGHPMPDKSPPPADLPRIFLSYAREDAAPRDDVRAGLETFADVWVDTEILPGADWPSDTLQAIADRDVLVLLVSRYSMDPASYCIAEVAEANRLGKRVVCLQLERFEKARLDERIKILRSINWIAKSDADWVQRLRTAVETDFERVRLHAIIAARLSQYENLATRGGLLTGRLLKRAQALADAAPPQDQPVLTPDQQAFISRSVKRRRGMLVAAAVLAAVIGIVIATVILRSRTATETANRDEAAEKLAAEAVDRADRDPVTALRLSLAAHALQPGRPMRNVVYQVLSRTHLAASFHEFADAVSEVAVDASGQTMLAAGAGGAVTMWDLTDRAQPRRLGLSPTPASPVSAAALAPDGQTLALADAMGSVSIWRRGSTGMTRTITHAAGGAAGYRTLLLSSDGRLLAAQTSDGVRLIRLTTDKAEVSPPITASTDRPAAFDSTGSVLATIGSAGLNLWDLSGPGSPKRRGTPIPSVQSVYFAPNSQDFVISTGTGGRRVERYTFTGTSGGPRLVGKRIDLATGAEHIAFDPTGTSLVIVDFQHVVQRLTIRTGKREGQVFTAWSDSLLPSALSHTGKVLVTSRGDGSVTVWDVTDRGQPTSRPGPTDLPAQPLALKYGANDNTLAAGFESRPAILWKRSGTGWAIGQAISGTTDIGSFAFGPGSRQVFAAGRGYPSGLFTTEATPRRIEPPSDNDMYQLINQVAGTEDGRRFAVSGNANVVVWEQDDHGARRLGQLPVPMRVFALAFAPRGDVVVVGAGDASAPDRGQVTFWNLSDPAHPTMIGEPLRTPAQVGTALDVSPDGRLIAVGAGSDTFMLVDGKTHRLVGPEHPGSGSHDVLFALGGRLLITADDSGAIIWDIADPAAPQPIGLPLVGTDKVSVTANASGAFLATGIGAAIQEWDLRDVVRQRDRTVGLACVAAGGGFGEPEWRTHLADEPYRDSCDKLLAHDFPTLPPPAAQTTAPAQPPTKLARVPLKLFSSTMKATAYFGQLAEVRDAAGTRPAEKAPTGASATLDDACAETVVVQDVSAPTAVVYGEGLDGGWRAAEGPPDKAAAGHMVRQQIVLPPRGIDVGSVWSLSATITSGNTSASSTPFSTLMTAQSGREQTWLVDGTQTVTCAGD